MLPSVQLLHGETVTVRTPTYKVDENRDVVEEWADETVDNVLVAPGSTSDVDGSARLHGSRAVYTLGFPKTFRGSLRGCRVVVRGDELSVVGDPRPNDPANCPTPWWLTAEVEAVDG